MTDTRCLGRFPAKSTRKALMFSDFFKYVKLPRAQTYWQKRAQLPLRSFGNLQYGDCTRASQAVMAMRMERLEQRKTIQITDEEVIRVYVEMSNRLYGGGDNGAYEDDALNEWRDPEKTFKDTTGQPYTIDAYLKINAANHEELKAALALAAAKGIKVCINLPAGFASLDPPAVWDVPADAQLVGPWMPGSWGGHSLTANGYTSEGIVLDHTWMQPNQVLSWRAAATYLDEAHLIVDSVDTWRTRARDAAGAVKFKVSDVIDAVNAVSANRIDQ